jgi:hypothetical protein
MAKKEQELKSIDTDIEEAQQELVCCAEWLELLKEKRSKLLGICNRCGLPPTRASRKCDHKGG